MKKQALPNLGHATNKMRAGHGAWLHIVALAALIAGLGGTASAQNRYWYAQEVEGIRTGTWNTDAENTVWNPSADGSGEPTAWVNGGDGTTGPVANFTASSAVTASEPVTARNMLFNLTGATRTVTLSGSPITLTRSQSGSPLIEVTSGLTTVTINNLINFDGVSNIRLGSSSGSSLTLAGGLNFTGATVRTLQFNNISSSTGAGTIDVSGNITKDPGTASLNLEFGSTISHNNMTYKLGGNNTGANGSKTLIRGTLVLNHNNALGGTAITMGHSSSATGSTQSLLIGADGVSIGGTINLTSADNTSTRTIGSNIGDGTATFGGGVNLNGTGANVTAAAGGTTVFSGNINDGTNTFGITKIGSGVVKFTRAAGNTYDGVTTVSAGTLLINNTTGSGTGTGNVVVGNGAAFGGTGIAEGAVTLNAGGQMTPGDEGAGTFAGSLLTWSSNDADAGMVFDLGATSDMLTLSDAFTKGSGTAFLFHFSEAAGFGVGTYTLVTFGSTDFDIGDFGYTSSIDNFDGFFAFSGNSLTFTAVPEPPTYALLGLCFAAILWKIRCRQSGQIPLSSRETSTP